MIVLLYGGDELAIRKRLRELKAEADGGTGMVDSNYNVLDGREAKQGEIIAAAMSAPFLSARRMVVVEHIFERFEGRRDTERGLPKAIEALVAGIEQGIPESTILVFIGTPFGKDVPPDVISPTNALVKRLAAIKGVLNEHCPSLSGQALLDYIRAAASRRGLQFRGGKPADRLQPGERMPEEADPAQLLAALCHSDTLSIANELDKLKLYCGDGDVSVVEVNRVCAGERVAGAFELRDAVLDGNLATAYECKARQLRDGAELGELLFNITEAYRSLGRVVDAVEDRLPPEEIGKLMGRAGNFPRLRDNQIRRARAIGREGLRRSYEVIVEADRTNKLGEVDQEVAFDILLARLCEISRPVTAARRR